MNHVGLNEEDLIAFNAARDIPEDNDDGYITEPEPMDMNDVLDGTTELNFSHAGGEFQDIMEEELRKQTRYFFLCSLFTFVFTTPATPQTSSQRLTDSQKPH